MLQWPEQLIKWRSFLREKGKSVILQISFARKCKDIDAGYRPGTTKLLRKPRFSNSFSFRNTQRFSSRRCSHSSFFQTAESIDMKPLGVPGVHGFLVVPALLFSGIIFQYFPHKTFCFIVVVITIILIILFRQSVVILIPENLQLQLLTSVFLFPVTGCSETNAVYGDLLPLAISTCPMTLKTWTRR